MGKGRWERFGKQEVSRGTALGAVLLVLVVLALGPRAAAQGLEAARLNNIGVAFMNQQLPERALERFQGAHQADKAAGVPLLNAGIALLYQHKLAEAEATLKAATEAETRSARPLYCLGLLHLDAGDLAAARGDFQKAAKRAPDDADVHYFLGTAEVKAQDYAAARPEFEMALRLNPLHASAEFGLARALQRTGEADAARGHLARFKELTEQKNGTVVTALYSQQGLLAIAQEMPLPKPPVAPMIPVRFVVTEVADAAPVPPAAAVRGDAGLCVLDLAGDGQKTVLSVGDGPEPLQAYRVTERAALTRVDLKGSGLAVTGHGIACAVGDYDNDGLPDLAVALSERVVLFHNLGHGRFADVTAQAGLKGANQPTGLTFVDFDHDGDLDLFLTGRAPGGQGGGNVLWRNNGNATFTEWTAPPALAGTGETTSVAVSDLNNDRAIDFVVAGAGGAPVVYANRREGPFAETALFRSVALPPSRGVAIADLDKDGWMDVAVTHKAGPGVTLWHNEKGKGFERVALPVQGATAGWGVTALDLDNDGWIDLAVLVDTPRGPQVRVLRNGGPAGFTDVSEAVGIAGRSFAGARSLIAVDLRNRGVLDLVVGRAGAPPVVLRNEGAERHHSLRIQLAGLADNRSAIGTKVEVFADGLWQKFELGGSSGYASQGALEIVAGLGSHERADIVRLLWPTGVPQDELDVSAQKPLALKELDRRGSSCPVLFAWDGTAYRFVSDVIGAAVIGHWISPTEHNAADPDEWIKVDGAALQPRNGKLSLRFGEPMEEINYIDQLRLLAVDHPEGTEVYPNERFLSEKPFADGKVVVASPQTHAPAGAWDNNGQDVQALLAVRDRGYVRDFTNLSYAGFATPHTLTLDLGPWSPARPLRLFLYGFIEYFSASSMYAASQAGLRPEPPSVEAQLPDGRWTRVVEDMGFPAGLPRTIVADLTGKLPPGTRRIRLRTNLQIYWDQILVDNGSSGGEAVRETELPLSSATLAFRGYPQQVDGATPGDLTYDYARISQTGPFQWQRGPYTHYGEVSPLLGARDNRYVIFGSGEEIDAEFLPTHLPALPPHWKRDYFFYADGFVKDMDFYEAMPFTVTQLPFADMSGYPYRPDERFPDTPESRAYQLEWNDRFESGDRVQRYNFLYGSSASSVPR